MTEFFASYGNILFWAIIAVATLVLEAITADMVSIWFTPGAVVAMLVAVWVDRFWVQFLIFLALSALFLIITRRYFKKHPIKGESEKLNADALIGEIGTVLERIDNLGGTGTVKLGALVWTARAPDDGTVIEKGALVEVVEIRGVKLICCPTEKTTA